MRLPGVVLAAVCFASAPPPPREFRGVVDSGSDSAFILRLEDTRLIEFRTAKDTRFVKEGKPWKASEIRASQELKVVARVDDQGRFFALTVEWLADPPKAVTGSPAAPEEDVRAVERPIFKDPAPTDVEGATPPKLKRGKPERVLRAESQPAAASPEAPRIDVALPPAVEDPFLDKAREESEKFTLSLPNYVCRQLTTRYQRESRSSGFRALDNVSADVIYEDGKESYQNLRINGKASKKPVEETGTWSFGEFGTTLKSLLAPGAPTEFSFRKEATINGRINRIYGFHVSQPSSRWMVKYGGQWVYPEHKGTLWIDKSNYRVLRIEMEALNVPDSFPLDVVEWVVDYDWVRIGQSPFLVPVHAENLACWRSSPHCTKNAIDFRNYRRFTGEAVIYTTDSTVEYGTDKGKQPTRKK